MKRNRKAFKKLQLLASEDFDRDRFKIWKAESLGIMNALAGHTHPAIAKFEDIFVVRGSASMRTLELNEEQKLEAAEKVLKSRFFAAQLVVKAVVAEYEYAKKDPNKFVNWFYQLKLVSKIGVILSGTIIIVCGYIGTRYAAQTIFKDKKTAEVPVDGAKK